MRRKGVWEQQLQTQTYLSHLILMNVCGNLRFDKILANAHVHRDAHDKIAKWK